MGKRRETQASGSEDAANERRDFMQRVAQRFRPDGWTARTLRDSRTVGATDDRRMRPVPSCPATMLARIKVAKQSIKDNKARARKQGREYFPDFSPISFTELAVSIFERLACNPNMENVWVMLATIFDDAKRPPDTWAFSDFCYQTIGVWECSPRRSPAEHKEYFEQIADDVLSVAGRIVCEPEFGMIGSMAATVSPLEMVKNDALKWLMENMDADLIDGHYIKSEKDAISYLRFCLADVIPDLYDYAEWIATNARRIAAQPSISDRPHRETAQRTFFVKHLSKWFRDRFDKPMHEVVARVASALFDEAVTADTVRKAVNSGAEVSSPFRRGKVPLPD